MNRRTKIGMAIAAGVLALGATGAGIASFADGDGRDTTGPAADQARAAAVQAIPGARAGKVEADNESGTDSYSVDVTKPDGTQLQVRLDKAYQVLGTGPVDGDQEGEDG